MLKLDTKLYIMVNRVKNNARYLLERQAVIGKRLGLRLTFKSI